MTAVASSHAPEGLRAMDDAFSEPSTSSRFTAVNGQLSPANAARDMATNGHEDPRKGPSSATADANEVKIAHQPAPAVRPSTQPAQPPQTGVNDQSAPYSTSRARSMSRSPPTRKRSFPEAFGDSNGGHSVHRTHADPPEYLRRPPGPYTHAGSKLPPGHEIDQDRQQPPLSSDFDPHAQPSLPYYAQPHNDDSEARLADALQRANGDGGGARESFVSPDTDDPQRQQYGECSGNRNSMADAERKRRKRVFSNRTKTGCMTCRKRKKKCDELHPECNNCLRGGFVCEGYTVRNTWQKPTPSKAPVPLQSKNGYGTPGPQQHPLHYSEVSPEYGSSSGPGPGSAGPNGSEHKPILVEEDRRDHPHLSSPIQGRRSQGSWSREQRQYPSHPPAQRYHDMDRSPAAHEMPHEVPDPTALYPSTSAHQSLPYPQSRSGPPSSQSAPAVAQAALQNPILTQRPASHSRVELTEREKMLRGEYYLPYTPALMEDREQCAAAVWRFNNSTNPTNGISPEERIRFFKKILSLRPTPEPQSPTEGRDSDPAYLPVGRVGADVIVEAPFHCDYGYNINIGSNVIIGPDCRITDTCAVTIGSNVVFSPGVKLVCATYGIDPRERKKGKGRALGRNIIIEDDSWIGSNVTILPGVRVGRSSTVGAGSLICKDVPPYTVVAGNPQKVVRGIYEGN